MGNKSSHNHTHIETHHSDYRNEQKWTDNSFGRHNPQYVSLYGHHHESFKIKRTTKEPNCIYSSNDIDSMSKDIATYYIKINKLKNKMRIGFTSCDEFTDKSFTCTDTDNPWYCCSSTGIAGSHSGFATNNDNKKIVWKSGSVIILQIDLRSGEIVFSYKSKDNVFESEHIHTFSDIAKDVGIEYKLVIATKNKGDSVTIEYENPHKRMRSKTV